MRQEIMQKLQAYFQEQGVAFMSQREAEEFYKGLVELIESLIVDNAIDDTNAL